ncbi:hypothetical protein HNY73_007282 [Argiope bruennichi]|uniref:Uncharacterized protein n=1 Tax=Argiope bruennichi TaxID=94029 RepID=A0A8T0FEG1_ARGBR|nr:hypothetical protein HNY73_007282 [Argiope bruennichi]
MARDKKKLRKVQRNQIKANFNKNKKDFSNKELKTSLPKSEIKRKMDFLKWIVCNRSYSDKSACATSIYKARSPKLLSTSSSISSQSFVTGTGVPQNITQASHLIFCICLLMFFFVDFSLNALNTIKLIEDVNNASKLRKRTSTEGLESQMF